MGICNAFAPLGYVPGFWAFPYTMTVPEFYWDAESQEQRVKYICELFDKFICYVDGIADQVNLNRNDIDALTEQFKKFVESGFDDYYREQVVSWIAENMEKIVSAMTVSTVYFGLTDDGYFTAYYPMSWKAVQFDTIADYSNPYYGCLTLFY